jgi:hypothetical protein
LLTWCWLCCHLLLDLLQLPLVQHGHHVQLLILLLVEVAQVTRVLQLFTQLISMPPLNRRNSTLRIRTQHPPRVLLVIDKARNYLGAAHLHAAAQLLQQHPARRAGCCWQ